MSYLSDFNAVFGDQTLLGELPKPLSQDIIIKIETGDSLYLGRENHRYQGVRESFKFERTMQQMINFTYWFQNLRDSAEATSLTINSNNKITDTVYSRITHALKQLEFGSYQKLKTKSGRWY